jgi:hypothetical protein
MTTFLSSAGAAPAQRSRTVRVGRKRIMCETPEGDEAATAMMIAVPPPAGKQIELRSTEPRPSGSGATEPRLVKEREEK